MKLDEMTDKSERATRRSRSLQSENSERSTQKAEPKPKTFLLKKKSPDMMEKLQEMFIPSGFYVGSLTPLEFTFRRWHRPL